MEGTPSQTRLTRPSHQRPKMLRVKLPVCLHVHVIKVPPLARVLLLKMSGTGLKGPGRSSRFTTPPRLRASLQILPRIATLEYEQWRQRPNSCASALACQGEGDGGTQSNSETAADPLTDEALRCWPACLLPIRSPRQVSENDSR